MPASAPQPEQLLLASDGRTPNSAHPVLIYRNLPLGHSGLASRFERLFASHLWPSPGPACLHGQTHYHSTCHEVLGIARGAARLLLGGEQGVELELRAGDAVVLPAGTGHGLSHASPDLEMVSGYPLEQPYDSLQPDAASHDAAVRRIAQVGTPVMDPLAGSQGALVRLWRSRPVRSVA